MRSRLADRDDGVVSRPGGGLNGERLALLATHQRLADGRLVADAALARRRLGRTDDGQLLLPIGALDDHLGADADLVAVVAVDDLGVLKLSLVRRYAAAALGLAVPLGAWVAYAWSTFGTMVPTMFGAKTSAGLALFNPTLLVQYGSVLGSGFLAVYVLTGGAIVLLVAEGASSALVRAVRAGRQRELDEAGVPLLVAKAGVPNEVTFDAIKAYEAVLRVAGDMIE